MSVTALAPFARLIDMRTNTVLASTRNITAWSIERVLDQPGMRSLTVPLGDAGDGTDAASGFAAALLAAVGGPGVSGAPVPTLVEFSLDGGTTVDARWMVTQAAPDLAVGQLVLTTTGPDTGSLYNMNGPDRFGVRDVALADILGGTLGNIVPLSSDRYGISADGKIPGLRGLFAARPGEEQGATPGDPLWSADAQARVAIMPVVSNALESTLAFLGMTIDALEDPVGPIVSAIDKILGGAVFPTDPVDQGSRGHAVWCDSDANLSGDIEGVVCDGTPTLGTPGGTNGFSNDATHHPTGVPRALVIGNVGGSPRGNVFTFDGTATLALDPADEPTTARLFADATSLQPDLSPLYGEVRLTGGTNDAGLAQGEAITCLITLNNQPADDPAVAWTDVLPIIGTNLADQTGGVYFDAGDGRLRGVPSWTLAAPVYALCVNNQDGIIYAATSQGVYAHSTSDLTTSTTLWTRVGGLAQPVKQLVGLGVETNFFLYALVSGVDAGHDGVYQYNHDSPSAVTTVGYTQWVRFLAQPGLLSIAAVSDLELFFLTPKDSAKALHYYHAGDPTTPFTIWTLGTGIQGVRVDRVTTANEVTPQDSVWVTTSGGAQPGYYLLYSGTAWVGQSLQEIDSDGSLATAVGTATGLAVEPQINRAVPLGYGINGVTIAVMLCTQAGVYDMAGTIPATGGVDWSAHANGQNGLAGLSITTLVAGQPTQIPSPTDPTAYVSASRMYAINGSALFFSYLDSYYWRDLLREPLVLAPYFYALAASALGDLPSYGVQTIGPMASSPLGADAATHVQVTDCLPAGWYWRRRWNACYEPYYALVNSGVPFPQVYTEQVTEVAVTPAVDIEQAAADLAIVYIVLLGERSRKQATITVAYAIETQEAGARYLWPTHQVLMSQTGQIKMLSSDGETLIATSYIDLDASPFYVLSHTLTGAGPLVSGRTVLAPTVRGTPQTGADLAASLVQALQKVRTKGLRSKRQ